MNYTASSRNLTTQQAHSQALASNPTSFIVIKMNEFFYIIQANASSYDIKELRVISHLEHKSNLIWLARIISIKLSRFWPFSARICVINGLYIHTKSQIPKIHARTHTHTYVCDLNQQALESEPYWAFWHLMKWIPSKIKRNQEL